MYVILNASSLPHNSSIPLDNQRLRVDATSKITNRNKSRVPEIERCRKHSKKSNNVTKIKSQDDALTFTITFLSWATLKKYGVNGKICGIKVR